MDQRARDRPLHHWRARSGGGDCGGEISSGTNCELDFDRCALVMMNHIAEWLGARRLILMQVPNARHLGACDTSLSSRRLETEAKPRVK